MKKVKPIRRNKLRWSAYLLLLIAFVSAMSMTLKKKQVLNNKESEPALAALVVADKEEGVNNAAEKREQESKQAFLEAYKVFIHPRCMNCHPAGDIPLQGDDSHLHAQGVKRGKDGKGLYALKCKNCHQDMDLKGDNLPPGHASWHLPPANRKMVFEGKTPRQLAMQFKDPKQTGFSSLAQFIHHVEEDGLVKHSFTYGVRPPLTHEEFVVKVKEWVEKGAVLPDK